VAELTLGEADNGKERAARIGDTIILRLAENAGGGYRWTLTPVDTRVLEMVEHHFEAPRGVGGVGTSVWLFTPKQPGRAGLELKKVRPWNADDPAAQRFEVHLNIRGA
jgi:predicted secreted protein